jgi:hypothetical protein
VTPTPSSLKKRSYWIIGDESQGIWFKVVPTPYNHRLGSQVFLNFQCWLWTKVGNILGSGYKGNFGEVLGSPLDYSRMASVSLQLTMDITGAGVFQGAWVPPQTRLTHWPECRASCEWWLELYFQRLKAQEGELHQNHRGIADKHIPESFSDSGCVGWGLGSSSFNKNHVFLIISHDGNHHQASLRFSEMVLQQTPCVKFLKSNPHPKVDAIISCVSPLPEIHMLKS